ncbi:MAG TPA: hypothetical protein VMB79_03190, partial [Jatrophihabitans sp.]|nr:hypothetical protein [Jatrophihabitans sp.]
RAVGTGLAGDTAAPGHRLAYLARLLHDLRYHTERDRHYYADLTWWHLAEALGPHPAERNPFDDQPRREAAPR